MASEQFPESLAWVERGSVLIRRMNSERIAEDPRVRRLLLKLSLPPSPTEVTAMEAIAEENGADDSEEKLQVPRTFEAIEAATDANDVKQESENSASNTYKVLLWTYRLQASLQSAVQYALFAKTSEDGCFIQIAPRVYCVAPPHITTFSRLFGAYTSARNWNAAVKVLEQLDSQMSKRFEDGACVFDCGLFDGVKRMHHKPLVFDDFCDASSFPENFGNELLSAYLQHIKMAETWPVKLQRTFSGNDPKNAAYTGGLPRPQARYIADFGKLLEMRDNMLVESADSPALEEKKQKLTDLTLEKIDVVRKALRNRVDIYLLFHVDAGHGQTKVLPLRHLFRFVLPDIIREKVIAMGATQHSLDENAPSSFDVGAGMMPFDEEYARWLQHLYETDLDTPGNNYDDEFVRGISVADIQPSLDYRIVSIETEANEAPLPARDQHGRRPYTSQTRGAPASLINQLPTYTFTAAKDHEDRGTPDFEAGEEIKSLPCFHSYHSDCVDSWLSLNKVCPVCQFSVDN
uniref:RING-type domain-containing protein n=1 Tax=Phytophthora ramorum TaxID=164328 RepID=H3HCS9_PHYRM